MSCNCICPEVNCGPVLSCIKDDLARVHVNNSPTLDNFCAAVSTCVDLQFEALANGASNQFDFFGPAINKILQSYSNFTESGNIYLTVTDGTIQWTSATIGHTYFGDSASVTASGNGSSGNPYKGNIVPGYVRGLFSATNGLSYSTGVTKLGGTLTENTTISGGNLYNLAINDLQNFTLEVGGATYLQIASYSGAASGDVLTLSNSTTGLVEWKTPSTFAGNFISNQHASNQTADFRISGNGSVGSRFAAGMVAGTAADVSHVLRGVSTDSTILSVANSSGTSLFGVTTQYIYIPSGTSDPGGLLPNNAMYYNSSTSRIRFYSTADGWHNKALESRLISTQHSLTGGGDLSANRTLSLVNDQATPGNSKYYGTDSSGTKGWYGLTSGVTSIGIVAPSIFNVSNSPVTSSGDITLTLATQSANMVFAGPSSGLAATPTFRPLVTSDLPDDVVTFDKIQNIGTSRILGRSSGGTGSAEQLMLGSHLVLSAGTLNTRGRTLVGIQKFTSSGTWVKPTGCNAAIVYVIGGGGGGGGAVAAAGEASVAGGGGGGGSAIHFVNSPGASETVTVGAGGAGGLAGLDGSDGGTSSFGGHCSATGGYGGKAMPTGSSVALAYGGAGGIGTGSIVSTNGEVGRTAFRLGTTLPQTNSGRGGGTIFGHYSVGTNGAGGPGSGAYDDDSATGSPGEGGCVIVFEYS